MEVNIGPIFGSEFPGNKSNYDTIINYKFALITRKLKPQSTQFYFLVFYRKKVYSFLSEANMMRNRCLNILFNNIWTSKQKATLPAMF